jgi:Lon protease-like protein
MGYVQRLALFPLNTVLFPGMVLPLHIFEDRYLCMIQECAGAGDDFGVALIKEGAEVGGPAWPHEVGTTARLTSIERLNDGRLKIETVGRRRLRILSLHHDRRYLTADVEFIPLRGGDMGEATALATRVRPHTLRYLELIAQAQGIDIGAKEVPRAPAWLAYMTAIILQLPDQDKQRLLAAADVVSLLTAEMGILRKEEAILRFIVRTQHDQDRLVTGAMNYLYRN